MDSSQLLIILIIVILSLLEGLASRRRKAQRERAGHRKPADQPDLWGEVTRRQRESERASPARPATVRPGERVEPEPAQPRTSAEILVPEDLWEAITGQRRAQRERREERAIPVEAQTLEGAGAEEARDALPEAVTLERVEPEERAGIETLEAEAAEVRAGDQVREPAPPRAGARLEKPVRPTRLKPSVDERLRLERERRARERRALAEQLEAAARGRAGASEEEAQAEARHEALHRRIAPPAPTPESPAPKPTPAAAPVARARLALGLRQPSSLRRALVLKEILDPPLALRDPEGDPFGGPASRA
ncbi:MAG: hypothetical protein HY704_11195 [Gemmatimonadetes bacterium]|nr:hypothetical protein [Gemmatimonadota bacterium]